MANANKKISVASDDVFIDGENIAVLENTQIYAAVKRAISHINDETGEFSADDLTALMNEVKHEQSVLKFLHGVDMNVKTFKSITDDDRLKDVTDDDVYKFKVNKYDNAGIKTGFEWFIRYLKADDRRDIDLYRYVKRFYDADDKNKVLTRVAEFEQVQQKHDALELIVKDALNIEKVTKKQQTEYGALVSKLAQCKHAVKTALGEEFLTRYDTDRESYAAAVDDTYKAQMDALSSISNVIKIRRAEVKKAERIAHKKDADARLKELNNLYNSLINENTNKTAAADNVTDKPKRSKKTNNKKSTDKTGK